jgi:aspartate/methionine/tyrosine aminotransferase
MRLSARAQAIEPFYVMEVAKAASAMARELEPGSDPMLFMNIGEPDFTAVPAVVEAAERALRQGHTQYTHATGLMPLRERISGWYRQRFGLDIAPSRIVVTAGASAALHLACLALIDPEDEILMPDPSYACNRNFVAASLGKPVLLPATAEERFQLSADRVATAWGPKTRGVLLASPSNPTGTSIDPAELARIHHTVQARGGVTLVDEIYLGLSFDARFGQSALALGDDVISINSFSKYFNMTGWRLGWLVVPPSLVNPIERLAQNLFICASTVAQHAALACFEEASLTEFERRRAVFQERRDFFVPGLAGVGMPCPVQPDGAFYAWADCRPAMARLNAKFDLRLSSSWDFAFEVMRRARVAVTPGRDFGRAETEHFVRFSTASSTDTLRTALSRLHHLVN